MKTLGQIVEEARAARAQQSLYSPLAQSIAGINPITSSSTGKNVAQSLIQGLLVGGLTGMEARDRRQTDQALAQLIPQALRNEQLVKPEGIDEGIFNQVSGDLAVFKALRDLEGQDRRALLEESIEKERRLAEEKDKIEAAKEQRALERNAQQYQSLFGRPAGATTPTLEITNEETLTPSRRAVEPLDYGTVEDRIRQTALKAIMSGATPAQAEQTARELYKDELSENKLALKQMREEQVKLEPLTRMAAEGEIAAKQAGETGALGRLNQAAAGIVSGTLGRIPGVAELPFVKDQEEKYIAGQKLETMAADIVKAAREAGSGVMSDRDVVMYLQSGIGLGNPLEVNVELARRAREIASSREQYISFMRDLMTQGYTSTQAQQAYDLYKSENPPFIYTETDIKYNAARPSPKEWLMGAEKAKEVTPSEMPQASKESAGVPQVGQMYNGERVVSVKRIK